MMTVSDYLGIPKAYGRWLGGLRWDEGGEAIEYAADAPEIGLTFAMSEEVARFLEGVASAGGLPHFAYVLHVLQLLGFGSRHGGPMRPGTHEVLARAFRETGRPLRNAGVLCAVLCRDVPDMADSPRPEAIQLRLKERSPIGFGILRQYPGEEPPWSPEAFDAHVRGVLQNWSLDELRHWLRHGRGPIPGAGEAIARAMPKTLAQALAALEDRPRLRGATGLVARLGDALTLPPRRLAHAELPLGGYTDVVTRGLPEQILPFQFALDPDEFLRRFAARELLYFHREEPHAPQALELLLVIDQGVRTWGDVRLVLAAAALALGRQAERHQLALRVATTGNGGEPVDVLGVAVETLGELLESSDLTPDPAPALARALGSRPGAGVPRDVVLLTHPRTLAEPAVTAAARGASGETRLFAVAVNPAGEVMLSELRAGAPVAIGRCRVDLAEARARQEAASAAPAGRDMAAARWRGDIEPIGFPFRLGALAPFQDSHFTFDDAGDWLLLAGRYGLLHAWRADGSDAAMLPRAMLGGEVLDSVQAVIGVAGGFVVAGIAGPHVLAAHYDWRSRTCTAHALGVPPASTLFLRWSYVRHLHCVVGVAGHGPRLAIDLAEKGLRAQQPHGVLSTARGSQAFAFASQAPLEPVVVRDSVEPSPRGRVIALLGKTGEVAIRYDSGEWQHHIPRSEGRPSLAGGQLIQARWGESTLALLVAHADGRRILHLYALARPWYPQGEHVLPRDAHDFALSRDGRRVAWRLGDRQLVARDVGAVGPPSLVTPKGKTHAGGFDLKLGDRFLTIRAGRHAHLVRWDLGRLEFARTEGEADGLVQRVFGELRPRITARGHPNRPAGLGHRKRFVAFAVTPSLTAAVDRFGQVALLDAAGKLVCMLFVFREQIAAWSPDGARIGPVPLIAGPPTLDGEQRIGAALRAATDTSRGPAR